LRVENFIYFFTVCGFFVGLVFSIANFNDPMYVVFYTFLITLFFYLLIHLSIASFLDIKKTMSLNLFNKKKYEEVSDYFVYELEKREGKLGTLIETVNKLNRKKHVEASNNELQEKLAA